MIELSGVPWHGMGVFHGGYVLATGLSAIPGSPGLKPGVIVVAPLQDSRGDRLLIMKNLEFLNSYNYLSENYNSQTYSL